MKKGAAVMTETGNNIAVVAQDTNKTDNKFRNAKVVVKCAVGGLVVTFVTAVSKSVASLVGGNKIAKFGVQAGGFLVGMWLGGEVSDRIVGFIQDTMNVLEDVKKAIENGGSN